MTSKKAIEVKVLVNGTAAQEYNDDDEENNEPNIVTRFIEALSGLEFEVQYELKPSFRFPSQHLGFNVSIDGKALASQVISKECSKGGSSGRKGTIEGISRSDGVTWSLEKFRFSDLKISLCPCMSYNHSELSRSGDDQTQNPNSDLKVDAAKIGTITLKVHRMSKGVYHKPGTKGSAGWDDLTELGTLPEKALKGQALSHCTRYGNRASMTYSGSNCACSLGLPQSRSPSGVWVGCEYLDGRDKPFAVFNFKYRSRSACPTHSGPVSDPNYCLNQRPCKIST